jgi:Zn-dependent peptidase ImmA (M78 family)
MPDRHDPLIAAFLRQHRGTHPATVVRRLCNGLLHESGATIPVDMRMLASYRGVAEVATADQDEAGCNFDGDRLVIHTRRTDSEERRRFTVGHEISHTFFPGFQDQRRSRSDATVGQFDRNRTEEYLCDIGAAELLLPRAELRPRLPRQVDLDAVIELASLFEATIEATALRVAALSGRPAAVVVLEPGWRKSEEAHMRHHGNRLAPARPDQPPIPQKLRVKWSASHHGFPVVPRNKSVGDTTPLADILHRHHADYHGETGLTPGPVTVSARHLPYRRGDTWTHRVLLLLQQEPSQPR